MIFYIRNVFYFIDSKAFFRLLLGFWDSVLLLIQSVFGVGMVCKHDRPSSFTACWTVLSAGVEPVSKSRVLRGGSPARAKRLADGLVVTFVAIGF